MNETAGPARRDDPARDGDEAALLLDSITDYLICVLDPAGRVRTWNTGAERITLYPAAEAIGMHVSMLHTPEDRAEGRPERELEQAARSGRFEEERWRVRRDGTRFWANVVVTALRGRDGELRGFAKVTRDLTERRAVEERLRQSEARGRLLIESARDYAIFMLDPAGRVASWNAGAERINGYRFEEIIGRHFSVFYPEADVRAGKCERELEVAAAEGRYEEEGWRVREGGSRFWASVIINAVRGEQGELIGFAKITRDLTQRREAEESRRALEREQIARAAAEEAEGRFRFLAEASAILGTSLDYKTTLQSLADLAVPYLGDWCGVEVLEEGRLRQMGVAHVDREKLAFALELGRRWPPDPDAPTGGPNVLRTGRTELYESIPDEMLVLAAKSDEHLRLIRELGFRSAVVVPLVARGKTLGVMTLVWAESRRNYSRADLPLVEELGRRAGLAVDNARLFLEAQRAVKLRDEFLSIASHELRTPLTTLQLQVSGMRRQLQPARAQQIPPGKLLSKVEAVDRNVERLGKLVNNLLDVSRASSGRWHLELEPVDLSALVDEVSGRLREELANAGCALEVHCDERVVGNWDRLRLDQVLTNFLSNAIKYGAGKPVEVRVARRGESALLAVRDHGLGIAPEDQSRIFERFGRAVSVEHYGGLGLGLWIVRLFVEAMGGVVTVDSQPGLGSVFTAELPLSPPRSDAAQVGGSQVDGGAG